MAKHVPFDEACAAEPGVEILSEESLGDGSVATTLRTRSGEMTITDGPFAEAAEQIGGTPEDLDGVLRLCEAEGWPSFPADPERASRVLTAPGVTTVVAVDDQRVVGFAQLFSDGELQAFLANIAVDVRTRGEGLGRALVMEALRLAGGQRVDLLSEDDAAAFYESFPHFRKPGYRLYPFHRDDAD